MNRNWTIPAIGVAAAIVITLVGCSGGGETTGSNNSGKNTSSAPTVTDPVCGMKLTQEQIVATHEYEGDVYAFCMTSDRDEFAADPERYLKGGAAHGDSTGCAHHGGADTTGCPHHGDGMGGHHGDDGGDDGHGGHHDGDDGGMGGMHGGR